MASVQSISNLSGREEQDIDGIVLSLSDKKHTISVARKRKKKY